MTTPMTVKEFRKIMSTKGTKFNIEGYSLAGHMFAGEPALFTVGQGWIEKSGNYQMNVGYMGNTKMDLYTFDMMGNKTTATIKFKNVIIIK